MKSCSYCGKKYSDDVAVCPVDGQPVIGQAERPGKTSAPPQITRAAFDAKLVSPLLSAGTYRIFIERNDLLFIQMEGGSKSILGALAPLLGPLGNLIPLVLWLFSKKDAKARRQQLEEGNPEDLLRASEKNFRLNLAEIRDAAIEPPAFIAASGKAGRLNLVVRHGEKMKFEFENAVEMTKAMHLLIPALNSALRINVEWNGEKQRFEKKKNDLTRQSPPASLLL